MNSSARYRRRGIGLSASVALAAAAMACSAKTTTQGELVVVVESDLSYPTDADNVRVEVLSGGASQFDSLMAVGVSGLRLPATLGVIVGADPSTPVTVRVSALHNGNATILREAVTTVPASRIAMLRMPIAWVCEGSASGGQHDVTSTCPTGQTCEAGVCLGDKVDSAKLPDYVAADVFGGATAPGSGKCFDTKTCFAAPQSVTVDLKSCTFPAPADPTAFNLAIVPPAASPGGVCNAAGCFVPIDKDPSEGWSVDASGGTVTLAQGICSRLTQVSQAHIVATTACAAKTPKTPQCGSWSSVGSQ